MRVTLLAVLFLMALTACTHTVLSRHCTAFEANPPTQAEIDVMTPERKAAELAELLKFERICGVKL
jgi:hypothetical protein